MRQKGHFRVLKHLIRLGWIEIFFLVLGILGGYVYTVLADTSLIWRSLGTPPGKAIRIVDGDYLAVRVQTGTWRYIFLPLPFPQAMLDSQRPSIILPLY